MRLIRLDGLCVGALLLGVLALATPAHAELVFFSSGRSLSVKEYRIEGDQLVLTLRTGGEIICDRSGIVRIEPDEVPYPEPEPEPGPALIAAAAQVAAPLVPFGEIIDQVSARHGVPAGLVRAVIKVESAYRQGARSRKGAMGLMQLMPDTARQYAVGNPYEARANIEGGTRYLKALLERFELPIALAAYNAGEGAVRRFGGIPPYPETQAYVRSVLRAFVR
ncbi:MAG: lytic transglycosylase domain-containing protein [Acidobacteriota bacterium]